MYILHIETSTTVCSVALSNGPDLVEVIDMVEGMNHTALLTPSIDQLLRQHMLKPGDLKAVSVSSGPGSYTGLRVGSSTAKAMAYTLKIPLLPVPTLLALSQGALARYPQAHYFLPLLDARRNEVYAALYDHILNEVLPPFSLILDAGAIEGILPLDQTVICGDGAGKVVDVPNGHLLDISLKCSAAHLVSPAFRMLEKGTGSNPLHFAPFYLKPPNITQSKKIF